MGLGDSWEALGGGTGKGDESNAGGDGRGRGDLGCRDALTRVSQGRSPTPAPTAAGLSPTAPTSAPTSRPTRMSRSTGAVPAPGPSPACRCWPGTRRGGVAVRPEPPHHAQPSQRGQRAPRCAVLRHAASCHVAACCAVLHRIIPRHAVLCHAAPCHAMPCCAMPCRCNTPRRDTRASDGTSWTLAAGHRSPAAAPQWFWGTRCLARSPTAFGHRGGFLPLTLQEPLKAELSTAGVSEESVL